MKSLNFEVVPKCKEFCSRLNLGGEIGSNILLFLLLSDLNEGLVQDFFSCKNKEELKTFLLKILAPEKYSEAVYDWSKAPVKKKVEYELWCWSKKSDQLSNTQIIKKDKVSI